MSAHFDPAFLLTLPWLPKLSQLRASGRQEHPIQVERSQFGECAKCGIEFTSVLSPTLFPLRHHPSIWLFYHLSLLSPICPVIIWFQQRPGFQTPSAHADKYHTKDFDSGCLLELFLSVVVFASALQTHTDGLKRRCQGKSLPPATFKKYTFSLQHDSSSCLLCLLYLQ